MYHSIFKSLHVMIYQCTSVHTIVYPIGHQSFQFLPMISPENIVLGVSSTTSQPRPDKARAWRMQRG